MSRDRRLLNCSWDGQAADGEFEPKACEHQPLIRADADVSATVVENFLNWDELVGER